MSGIYIHIPFCKQACYYCDFHFSTSMKKKEDMLLALKTELKLRESELQNQTIETIYFGGGTPSVLSSDELKDLIETIYQNYEVNDNPEITLEANPDDLKASKIVQIANTPINRLSIGIQSFFDDDLQQMNRAHSSKESKQSLEDAALYFDNITIDLIYGIPNMNLEKWDANLQMAFDFGINHISSYALTVEPKTALDTFIKKGEYPKLDDILAQEHFNHLINETKKQGFVHYEISNFGKLGFFSKHNTSYWQGKPYLGIGPSAHSFFGEIRSWNVNNNSKYIKSIQEGVIPKSSETLTLNDRYNEYVMTGLRTIWGVSLQTIEDNFGLNFKTYLISQSDKFIKNKLLKIDGENTEHQTLVATEEGKFLIDGIASELFMI